ncbi:hypothetical protein [Sphingomonas sp. BAUL-RG-20F-R05-02]|jgi:hypothetical protein|uniref:hypothetical protein n=1 Tax=Sphingomonas sp. BAUL-RG-20F-R05-02 TaxID=2914830 RepID=UPI001F58C539|nr:hypothetical protein [Sphingomonas sp. BAUL-RG-20F-R05-02]
MIERVARELCRCDGYPEDLRYEGMPMWASYVDRARKGIAAMREPNKAVLSAGGCTMEHWLRMIDAVLIDEAIVSAD